MFVLLKRFSVMIALTAAFCIHAVGDDLENDSDASRNAASRKEEGDYVIEKKADGTKVKYKKKTTYDFEGDTIDGLHNKPSGSYISNIKDVKGRSIIRIRENFDAEVTDSARLLK